MRIIEAPIGSLPPLTLGETVYLSGKIITGRDEMHIRALERARAGEDVPGCVYGSALYHCGPIMRKAGDSWEAVAAGPTTSARMNSLEPEMIRRFGIKAIIGKGGMSRETCDAMRECGCAYLAAVGGAAVSLAMAVKKVHGVEWGDLGMAEAIWLLEVERMGPLVVAIDANGDSLYEKVASAVKRPF